ncbi:MAG: 30S ribosomal protein S7 [Phycisphaerales bacterium]|nr:30S ribosomal protein S7 [Phycisphaerales bacterium]
MAGRITASDSQLRPDPKFGNRTLSKFINCIMRDGQKGAALRCVYDALEDIDGRLAKQPHPAGLTSAIQVFEKAIENAKPYVEVRSKRVGGANYQVPMSVKPRRALSLAFRWIIQGCRAEKGRPMSARLADELLAASRGEGKAMTTRDQTHRMAEANKAFSHFGTW